MRTLQHPCLESIHVKHAKHLGPCAHDLWGLRERTDVPDAMRSKPPFSRRGYK